MHSDGPSLLDPTPVDPRLLHSEVSRLRARETRRVFDPAVHVGVLGGGSAGVVLRAQDLPVLDAGLRTDVLLRLLEDSPDPWRTMWLLRAGSPDPHDADLAWLAAARSAFGSHGRRLEGCFVVTRQGWRDVLTDGQPRAPRPTG